MKLLSAVLLVVAAAHALPAANEEVHVANEVEKNGLLVNLVVQRAIAYLRNLIRNGNEEIGVNVLDPYRVDELETYVDASLLAMNLALKNANLTGMGDFVAERADLDVRTMLLQYNIVVPTVSIRAEQYKMNGLIFGAIPIYGEGIASFDIINLRMVGTAQLRCTDDGRSIIIEDISDAVFSLDQFIARTTGYIGGGDVDNVINAMLNEIAHDYATRFSRHISLVTTPVIRVGINSVLEKIVSCSLLPI